jgi:serine/threonine protein kinase
MIKRTSIVDPSHHYSFLEPLGVGSYSKVFLVRSKATGQLRALKKISKGKGHKADRHLIN